MTSVVDWTIALSTARRLVKPGPQITADGAAEAVAALRAAAVRAEAYVVEVTGLRNPCRQIEAFRPGLLEDGERVELDLKPGMIG